MNKEAAINNALRIYGSRYKKEKCFFEDLYERIKVLDTELDDDEVFLTMIDILFSGEDKALIKIMKHGVESLTTEELYVD